MAIMTFCTHTIFEDGASLKLADVLQSLGIKNPLLCTDSGLNQSGMVDQLLAGLGNSFPTSVFDQTPANPTEEAVEQASRQYKEMGCDGVVALGGGSSMDLAKAVALAVTHAEPLLSYTAGLGGMPKIREVAPLVAIPTTAGTGSEVSNGAVIIMRNGEKLILASKNLVPKVALCDPLLTAGMPPMLTAATGMDAVTHCIEALLSPSINPPAEAVACDGLERAIRHGHLLRAYQNGSDKEARWHMMMAATEGAMAFTKGLGAVHAMSHACGANPVLKLHHGTLNAVILPTVLEYNEGACVEKFKRLRMSLGLQPNASIADFVRSLNASLGLPKNLREMGIDESLVAGLADHAVRDVCNFTNPRPCSEEDYKALFTLALSS